MQDSSECIDGLTLVPVQPQAITASRPSETGDDAPGAGHTMDEGAGNMQSRPEDLATYANNYLSLHAWRDFGPMGAQCLGKQPVKGVAAAVSVNTDVIENAARAGCNVLLVHHGTFWNNESRTSGHWQKRIDLLEANDMTLLAYHLALDAHPKIGNNILAARVLGLGHLTPWQDIGWYGEYRRPMDVLRFAEKTGSIYGGFPQCYFFHPSGQVKRVAVIVGGAAQYVMQAKMDGFDTFFTGELQEPSFHLAKDLEMNLVGAGHDKTERAGVKALARELSRKFRVPFEFIDQPNLV